MCVFRKEEEGKEREKEEERGREKEREWSMASIMGRYMFASVRVTPRIDGKAQQHSDSWWHTHTEKNTPTDLMNGDMRLAEDDPSTAFLVFFASASLCFCALLSSFIHPSISAVPDPVCPQPVPCSLPSSEERSRIAPSRNHSAQGNPTVHSSHDPAL